MTRPFFSHPPMATRQIYVTQNDFRRLSSLIATLSRMHAEHDYNLDEFSALLASATKVSTNEIPGDVVTMNSTVRLRNLDSGEIVFRTLVFPHKADSEAEKISVLSLGGTALFGCRRGNTVVVDNSGDRQQWVIEEILYQPEADGEFSMDYTK
jgi:regulator of nucleoside diphosphate kinase